MVGALDLFASYPWAFVGGAAFAAVCIGAVACAVIFTLVKDASTTLSSAVADSTDTNSLDHEKSS